ncbi:hypothetical protein C8F04DRAFT_1265401 [Mycena alexandri]|uniref:Uncharacterized protein n=1 Tax=Mycena alexandri TaxID=1745969 RepID=A0AAD6SK95_9AGAR|nr:hypothetical protein C8F04DRAFT_1265401 [Mycena alexandri]
MNISLALVPLTLPSDRGLGHYAEPGHFSTRIYNGCCSDEAPGGQPDRTSLLLVSNIRTLPHSNPTATSSELARRQPSTPQSLTTRQQAASNGLSPIREAALTASSSLTSLDSLADLSPPQHFSVPNENSPAGTPAASPIASPAASPATSLKVPVRSPPTTPQYTTDSDSSLDSIPPPPSRIHLRNDHEEQGSKAPVVTAGDLTQKTLREFEISFENYAARKALSDKEQASHALSCFKDFRVTQYFRIPEERAKLLDMTFPEIMSTIRAEFLPKGWDRSLRICYIRVVQRMIRSGAAGRAERNRSPESELVKGGLDDATPQRG